MGCMGEDKVSIGQLPNYPLNEALWVGLLSGVLGKAEGEVRMALELVRGGEADKAVEHLNRALELLGIVQAVLNRAGGYFEAVLSVARLADALANALGQLATRD